MDDYAYCGKKLHNRGSYEKINGRNNYYFEGKKIAYSSLNSIGMRAGINVYKLELITPLFLKVTYNGSRSCNGTRSLYYIAVPS